MIPAWPFLNKLIYPFQRSDILIINRRNTVFIFIILLLSQGLFSNPFLNGRNEKSVPTVRPPSSPGVLVETQLEFRNQIGKLLTDLKTHNNPRLFFTLIGLAFLYGVLHAAGPGHRKTIIFSMFLTHKAKLHEPLLASFIASGAHAGSALFLILLFRLIFNNFSMIRLDSTGRYLEGITFIILLLLTLLFLIHSIYNLIKKRGHHHTVTGKGLYGTLLVSSLFPCPGVIMILTFSLSLGVLFLGVLAVVALSIGMGITISIVGFLAVTGRKGLFLTLKSNETTVRRVSNFLEIGSYTFLLFFSFWMVYPFIHGMIN